MVEHPDTVPQNESPIEWRLLTTHVVEKVQQALECIEWYKLRWYIEEIFRLLKSEGLKVERAQLESGEALRKLVLMGLIAAWHIMSLKLAYDRKDEENQAASIFTDEQIELLGILLPTLQGKTRKQMNPYKPESFAWASWIIARMGGWSGYASQAKPGYITFKDGYRNFRSKFEVFQIMKDVYRE